MPKSANDYARWRQPMSNYLQWMTNHVQNMFFGDTVGWKSINGSLTHLLYQCLLLINDFERVKLELKIPLSFKLHYCHFFFFTSYSSSFSTISVSVILNLINFYQLGLRIKSLEYSQKNVIKKKVPATCAINGTI